VDWRVRNHGNGFNYARVDVQPPEDITRAAVEAVRILGLHFGAVDIGWNEREKRATIYEVNTAPGLEGSTLHDYVGAIRKFVTK
jgi:D-alanine-D-alanine ligase-like ATP-grasp enzyme